ncbi:polyprotein [Rasavirus sp.]|nr:polyprotein [Rasavirus sp.]
MRTYTLSEIINMMSNSTSLTDLYSMLVMNSLQSEVVLNVNANDSSATNSSPVIRDFDCIPNGCYIPDSEMPRDFDLNEDRFYNSAHYRFCDLKRDMVKTLYPDYTQSGEGYSTSSPIRGENLDKFFKILENIRAMYGDSLCEIDSALTTPLPINLYLTGLSEDVCVSDFKPSKSKLPFVTPLVPELDFIQKDLLSFAASASLFPDADEYRMTLRPGDSLPFTVVIGAITDVRLRRVSQLHDKLRAALNEEPFFVCFNETFLDFCSYPYIVKHHTYNSIHPIKCCRLPDMDVSCVLKYDSNIIINQSTNNKLLVSCCADANTDSCINWCQYQDIDDHYSSNYMVVSCPLWVDPRRICMLPIPDNYFIEALIPNVGLTSVFFSNFYDILSDSFIGSKTRLNSVRNVPTCFDLFQLSVSKFESLCISAIQSAMSPVMYTHLDPRTSCSSYLTTAVKFYGMLAVKAQLDETKYLPILECAVRGAFLLPHLICPNTDGEDPDIRAAYRDLMSWAYAIRTYFFYMSPNNVKMLWPKALDLLKHCPVKAYNVAKHLFEEKSKVYAEPQSEDDASWVSRLWNSTGGKLVEWFYSKNEDENSHLADLDLSIESGLTEDEKKSIAFMRKCREEYNLYIADHNEKQFRSGTSEPAMSFNEWIKSHSKHESFVKSLSSKFISFCHKFLDTVLPSVGDFARGAINGFIPTLVKMLIPGDYSSCFEFFFNTSPENITNFIKILSVCLFLLGAICGVLTYRVFKHMLNALCHGLSNLSCLWVLDEKSLDTAVGQAPGDVVDSIITLVCHLVCVAVGTLTSAAENSLKSVLTTIGRSVTAANGLTKVAMCILALLPAGVKTALALKVGDKRYILQQEVEAWTPDAMSCIALRKNPSVCCSREYAEKLVVVIQKGNQLLMSLRNDNKLRSTVQSYTCQLLNILESLQSITGESNNRVAPFWLHIFGGAGLGKSAFVRRNLATMVTGLPAAVGDDCISDIHENAWNPGSEYLDGQTEMTNVLTCDELFTSVDGDVIQKVCLSLLSMVSCSKFLPNMAGVEFSRVGQKGTNFLSSYIITCSNRALPTPKECGLSDPVALYGRCRILAELCLKDGVNSDDVLDPIRGFKNGVDWNEVVVFKTYVTDPEGNREPISNGVYSPPDFIEFYRRTAREYMEREKLVLGKEITTVVNFEDVFRDTVAGLTGFHREDIEPLVPYVVPFKYEPDPASISSTTQIEPKYLVYEESLKNKCLLSFPTSVEECKSVYIVEEDPVLSGYLRYHESQKSKSPLKFGTISCTIEFDGKRHVHPDKSGNFVYPFNLINGNVYDWCSENIPKSDIPMVVYLDKFCKNYIVRIYNQKGLSDSSKTLINCVLVRKLLVLNRAYNIPTLDSIMQGILPRVGDCVSFMKRPSVDLCYPGPNLIRDCCPPPLRSPVDKLAIFYRRYWSQCRNYVVVSESEKSNSLSSLFTYSLAAVGILSLCDMVVSALGFGKPKPQNARDSEPMSVRGDAKRIDTLPKYTSYRGHRSSAKWGKAKAQATQSVTGYVRLGEKTYFGIYPYRDWFITYAHGLDSALNKVGAPTELRFCLPDDSTFVKATSELSAFTLPDCDLMAIRVPGMPERTPNLTKYFLKEADLITCSGLFAMMNVADRTYSGKLDFMEGISYPDPINGDHYELKNVWSIAIPSAAGWCGHPVWVDMPSGERKIVGLHVAGSNILRSRKAYSTWLSVERLSTLLGISDDELPPTGSPTMVVENVGCAQAEETVSIYESDNWTDYPNVERCERVSKSEMVFLPRKSNFKLSPVGEAGVFERTRQPSILSPRDPRAHGVDPVLQGLRGLCEFESPKDIDRDLVHSVFKTMLSNYTRDLDWHGIKRQLTMEEAIRGLPGLYKGLNLSSSAGWPYANKPSLSSKKSMIWFDEHQILHVSKELVDDVNEVYASMQDGSFYNKDFRRLGYLKSELQKLSKIEEGRTRLIYSAGTHVTIAFRMLFGALYGALNSVSSDTPMAIGWNQYSKDMNTMYNYLIRNGGNQFVAGDYRGFDQHYVEEFRDEAYWMLGEIAKTIPGITQDIWDEFVWHETKTPVQICDVKLYLKVSHFSGCFFTTVINCLMNEGYMRYLFVKLNPTLRYDLYVRALFCGDDHILCVKDGCVFDQDSLEKAMPSIGQEYTDDQKQKNTGVKFRPFNEISFLGATPTLIRGEYVGALRKSTLESSINYVRHDDESVFLSTVAQLATCASIWGDEYYNNYVGKINEALRKVGCREYAVVGCYEQQIICASRTAESELSFLVLPEGPDTLTSFQESAVDHEDTMPISGSMIDSTMATQEMPLTIGVDSFVYRDSFTWSSSQAKGTVLKSYDVPGGVLGLSNLGNLQNMPFDRMHYWRGGVELKFQINGTLMMQGLLCVYFMPLCTSNDNCTLTNCFAASHVYLSPTGSNSCVISIPYRYFREYMSTREVLNKSMSLGTVHVVVVSPLAQAAGTLSCDVVMYSRFPGSTFTMPAVAQGPLDTLEAVVTGMDMADRIVEKGKKVKRDITTLQRDDGSKLSISQMIGMIPTPTCQLVSTGLGIMKKYMRLDNTPVASGAIPAIFQYPGMSKAVGPEPLVSLQLNPAAIYRQSRVLFDPDETKVDWLCSKWCLTDTISWSKSNTQNSQLKSWNLNSTLGKVGINIANSIVQDFPMNLGVLNQFLFWHCDFEFEFRVVKTPYHSGRLRFLVGYGETNGVLGSATPYVNQVINFDSTNGVSRVRVPWNATTQFLRAFSGASSDLYTTNYDYSMGYAFLQVATPLSISSDVVATSVDILVFVRCVPGTVRVAVPAQVPNVIFDKGATGSTSNATVKFVVAQGPSDDVVVENDVPEDGGVASTSCATAPVLEEEVPSVIDTDCLLNLGEHFEFEVTDILEVCRRYRLMRDTDLRKSRITVPTGFPTGFDRMINIWVEPLTCFNALYAGWSGSINYRSMMGITSNVNSAAIVSFMPTNACMHKTTSDTTTRVWFEGGASAYPGLTVAMNGVNGSYSVNNDWQCGTFPPLENPVSFSQVEYINCSCPYQSHYNFLSVYHGSGFFDGTVPTNSGIFTAITQNSAEHMMFQSCGDDFLFGVFRPPRTCSWFGPVVSFTVPAVSGASSTFLM